MYFVNRDLIFIPRWQLSFSNSQVRRKYGIGSDPLCGTSLHKSDVSVPCNSLTEFSGRSVRLNGRCSKLQVWCLKIGATGAIGTYLSIINYLCLRYVTPFHFLIIYRGWHDFGVVIVHY